MEALLEVATDLLPILAMRVAYDRLVWGNDDIVRKREPVIVT